MESFCNTYQVFGLYVFLGVHFIPELSLSIYIYDFKNRTKGVLFEDQMGQGMLLFKDGTIPFLKRWVATIETSLFASNCFWEALLYFGQSPNAYLMPLWVSHYCIVEWRC